MASIVSDELQNYAPASNLLQNERIRNLIASGVRIYHFGFGQSPFPVIETAVESLRENAGQNAYLPVTGLPELRQGISDFHVRYDGISVDPGDIIVGPGSKELIFLLLRVFQGDIIVISPSWTTYKPQIILARHTPHIIYTSMSTDWKITPESLSMFLEANNLSKNKLLIFNNPDNPTGTSYSESELQELSKIFRENNVLVLSDEIYARLRFDQGHYTIAKVYPEGTILSSGLSKWASAGGWRLGYHIYPPGLSELREAVRSAASHTYTCASAPVQYASVKMLKDVAGCHDYILHTTRIMGVVSDFCYRELTSIGVKALKPTASYYIFPDFAILRNKLRQYGIDTCEQMCEAMLEECSVAVSR
ncbi:hypothetical protein ACJMK2_021938 [Sinanodonta woodiana]|uniref:Aminotransferase class I/classII large domain-containing protein n=1 Tax=Sinanodonta woodiana TaxID=1069815 RepID=A0ABD3TJK0_SINWO